MWALCMAWVALGMTNARVPDSVEVFAAVRPGYARHVKRHPALIPLSHDHHHGLVEARRLRRAAERPAAERHGAAAAFLRFFATDTRPHFREEEEHLFPLLVSADEPATTTLVQALLQHQRLHALASALADDVRAGDAPAAEMTELANALEQHIRFEERTLFPLIESCAPEAALRKLQEASAERGAVDPSPPKGGPVWGAATEDLNATLLAWPPGAGPPQHVNEERDVLVVVLAGSANVTVDDDTRTLEAGQAMTIAKGSSRGITAGPEGVRYLSVHTRRPPLQIARAGSRRA